MGKCNHELGYLICELCLVFYFCPLHFILAFCRALRASSVLGLRLSVTSLSFIPLVFDWLKYHCWQVLSALSADKCLWQCTAGNSQHMIGIVDVASYKHIPKQSSWHGLQGAAWLQSQATAAAAAAAAAALSPSHSPSNDSAAHPSAAGPSPHPLPASNPKARLVSKHRRHTSTTSFSAPDQAVPSSPRADALPTLGHPAAIPSSPRANALPSPGHSAAAASTSYAQAPASEAAVVAGASSSDTSRSLGTALNSTAPLLTGQESLDRATAALQALQQRYAPASSASGSDCQLSSPAASKPALQSTRSTFDFRSAVSGLPLSAGLASASQTDDLGTQPQQAQSATSAGLESDLTHDAIRKSMTASSSQDSMRTSSLRVASQAAVAAAAMATRCTAQTTVGGDQAPTSVQSASGPSASGQSASGQSLQAENAESQASSIHSDAISQQSGASVSEPGGGTSQLQLDLEDESDAISQQPHGSGSQSGSMRSLQGEQAGSDRVAKSRVGRLRVNEEGAPMADIYNLQSPGPVLLENALVSLVIVASLHTHDVKTMFM